MGVVKGKERDLFIAVCLDDTLVEIKDKLSDYLKETVTKGLLMKITSENWLVFKTVIEALDEL